MAGTYAASRTRTYAGREAEPAHCIEYARSGRSTCTECHKAVSNKALRLGVGQEKSYKWQHWTCVADRTITRIGAPDKLRGLDALRADDQQAVRQRLAGAGAGAGGKAPRKVHTLFD